MNENVTPDSIMQLGLGFWGSKTLLSAIELGIFTELAKSPGDAADLARRTGIHMRSARDFFDALVALGMLERSGEIYSNTPHTAQFLDRNKPSYMGGILEMANARLWQYWGALTEALRTGQPQNESKGGRDTFAALYEDPARLRSFLEAMTGISLGTAQVIAAKFPWKDYRTFVDCGTAQGGLPVQVALANPHLRGIGFDLPQVRPVFEDYVARFELSGRLRFEGGDAFTGPIPSGDVVVLGHVLHDWDLDGKRWFLRKAFEAIPPGGAVIVYDAIIDDDRRKNTFGLLMSLNMLIETQGGFDYTGADCAAWMREIGFQRIRQEPLAGPHSMVVGYK
jgi:hypothetical protein